jgi:hypothetical protein
VLISPGTKCDERSKLIFDSSFSWNQISGKAAKFKAAIWIHGTHISKREHTVSATETQIIFGE